jgi:hypothetical protein
MARYKITIIETAIYDAYVEAESLEHAQDIAIDNPNTWEKDVEASSFDLGDDNYKVIEGEWKEVNE